LNSETFGLQNKINNYTPRGQNYQYRNTNGRNYPRNGSGQQQQQHQYYRQSNNSNGQMRYSNGGQRVQSGQRTGGYQNNGYRRNDNYVPAEQRVGGRRFGSR